MGIATWLKSLVGTGEVAEVPIDEDEMFSVAAEYYIRNLAFESAVNLIANAISKCEFRTYVKKEEVQTQEYYLFNIEPNKNQNSSQFLHKLVSKLYEKNECLIIENNGQLFVADDYSITEYAFLDDVFKDVKIKNLVLDRSFKMSDVLFLKLNNSDIKKLINGMYEKQGQLIAYAQDNYEKSKDYK